MKTIVVTGGLGFLGSHLVDLLAKKHPKDRIVIVDNLSSNVVNSRLFAHKRNIVVHRANVVDYFKTCKPFDEVYHLASIVGPAGVLGYAGKIVSEIAGDAYTVALAALRYNAQFLYVSTSEVYGGGNDGFCSEEMSCNITSENSARVEYAVGKLGAEVALRDMTESAGLKCVIVRPFNIAGARQSGRGGFVLPRFLKAAQDGKPLTVFSEGRQVRSFTDVRDIAEGVYLAMHEGYIGEVYNLGNRVNRITIDELARRVLDITKSKSDIVYVDPKSIYGDEYAEANDKYNGSQKAEKELGWRPAYTIQDIIVSALAEREKR